MRPVLCSLAAIVLAACATSTPPSPPPMPPMLVNPGLPDPSRWRPFMAEFIEGWFRIDPANAVYQGRHDFDGGLADWSEAGLKAQGDFLRDAIARARAIPVDQLATQERFERDYLVKVAEGKLFWLEDADQPHRNPAWYIGNGLDPNVYVARNYADAATRAKALTAFLGRVPQAAANIRANLRTPMPLSFVEYGVAGFDGFADYYSGDAVRAFAEVKDADIQARLRANATVASAAMRSLARWLEGQRAGATQDFALGADRFSRMLLATEGVATPLSELETIGRADLQRNRDALVAACNRFAPRASVPACVAKMNANKPADGPVAEARRQIPELRAFAEVQDAGIQAQLRANATAASAAMRSLARWLEGQKAGATQNFALGADRFGRMLLATEGVDTPLAELEAIGQADLKRNRDALVAACARFAPGASVPACVAKMNANKPADGPVAEARRQIPTLRAFVVAHDLVTIPDEERALVEESPPYNRQNSAYIDPPGPFERGIPSIYYISPPDPAWDQATQDAFVPGKKDLLFTSIHEVMPGHFIQFRHANRSPSLFGRLFVGYAFAEGWAHYAEEMMWEAGIDDGAPETHIGQLSNALLRNCRFLSAIGLHTGRMTQDQSRRMFVEQCYQDEGNARQQAARGTYDPAYLNYTLGKLMIRRLRADWTATHGGRQGWKAFHDGLLSYGGPPIPLVRQAMMGEPTPRAVF